MLFCIRIGTTIDTNVNEYIHTILLIDISNQIGNVFIVIRRNHSNLMNIVQSNCLTIGFNNLDCFINSVGEVFDKLFIRNLIFLTCFAEIIENLIC